MSKRERVYREIGKVSVNFGSLTFASAHCSGFVYFVYTPSRRFSHTVDFNGATTC